MNGKKYIYTFTSYSFIGLWTVAAVSKLSNIATSKLAMQQQVFPVWMADILWWGIPLIQILLVLLLLYRPAQRWAIMLSTVLIASFSLYLVLGVTGVFGQVPCSCAGILASNNHWIHVAFNSPFLIIGIISWVLPNRYPRPAAPLDQAYIESSKLKADRSEDSVHGQQKGGGRIS